MKSVCLQLSGQEQQSLDMIMHEIYSTINSVDVILQDSAKIASQISNNVLEENIQELLGNITTLRMYLDYWQSSGNDSYYSKAKLINYNIYKLFKKPNAYFSRRMKKKDIHYSVSTIRPNTIIPFINVYPTLPAISNILFDNAIKYSKSGTEITCEMDVDDDDIYIRFTNFAPRLEEDELDKVFLCGSRGRNVEKLMLRGSGYGLNFLKSIIDAHKGEVYVSSDDYTIMIDNIPYSEFNVEIYLPKNLTESDSNVKSPIASKGNEEKGGYSFNGGDGFLEKI